MKEIETNPNSSLHGKRKLGYLILFSQSPILAFAIQRHKTVLIYRVVCIPRYSGTRTNDDPGEGKGGFSLSYTRARPKIRDFDGHVAEQNDRDFETRSKRLHHRWHDINGK